MSHFWLQYSTSTQHSASGVQYEYTLQYSTCMQCSMPCAHGISTWYIWICKSHYTSLSLQVPLAICVTHDQYIHVYIYIHMYIGPFTRSRSLLWRTIAVSLSLNRHPRYHMTSIGWGFNILGWGCTCHTHPQWVASPILNPQLLCMFNGASQRSAAQSIATQYNTCSTGQSLWYRIII